MAKCQIGSYPSIEISTSRNRFEKTKLPNYEECLELQQKRSLNRQSMEELFVDSVQSKFENKVGQIRSGGPSGGFKDDFLRSGGP